MTLRSLLALGLSLFLAGCADADGATPPAPPPAAGAASSAPAAVAESPGHACAARIAELRAAPAAPGAPAYEASRLAILGRARGEPLVLVREPAGTPLAGRPGARVRDAIRKAAKQPGAVRAAVLREGYLYASDPEDALVLATALTLPDLFDDPEIVLQRGARTSRLSRVKVRGGHEYRFVEGPQAGMAAEILLGDRVAVAEAELGAPLHRDLRALMSEDGFERARIVHLGESAIVADLRYDGTWVPAVLASDGARLSVACLVGDDAALERVAAIKAERAPRLRALGRLGDAITSAVAEALRFDRPEGEKTAERDGQLRPVWQAAYQRGADAFAFEGQSYPVFDARGRPHPPEVCMEFILDTFERSRGTWYRPRGEPPARVTGELDFDALGVKNRRGVLGFAAYAATVPELFELRQYTGDERVPFGERARFFASIAARDDIRDGDIVAIHGRKADGLIHQHGILVERTDPLTGFPYGLVDQMKRPRRRTWEGIMAEAPLRSLLYRVRPSARVLGGISDPGSAGSDPRGR